VNSYPDERAKIGRKARAKWQHTPTTAGVTMLVLWALEGASPRAKHDNRSTHDRETRTRRAREGPSGMRARGGTRRSETIGASDRHAFDMGPASPRGVLGTAWPVVRPTAAATAGSRV